MRAISRIVRGQLLSVVAVAAAIGLLIALVTGSFSSGGGHDITAEFTDAQSITKGNTVHVDGVTAGTVTAIRLVHNTALLTLHLNPGFWPIHRDATADIRPVSLLGEDYVQLDPGSAGAPALPDHGTITTRATTNSVNLQTVLNAINDPTSTALAVLLTSLGQGMAGRGADGNADLRALAPALGDTTRLTDLLDQQDQVLTSLLDQVTPVTNALAADRGATLDQLVGATQQTLHATAATSGALGQDLQELPGFLSNTTTAFDQLGTLSDQATPALASLDPLTGNLAAFSAELRDFATAAQPAAADLTPVLDATHQLLGQTGPVVDSLQSSAPAQLADAASLIPIVQRGLTGACTSTDCPGLDDLFGFVRNWALATQNYDGLSHYFRFFTNFSATPLSGLPGVGQLLNAVAPAPTAPAASNPLPSVPLPSVPLPSVPLPSVPLPSVPLPSVTVPTVPGAAPGSVGQAIGNGVSNLLGGSSAPSSSAPASSPVAARSATGLSQGQEQDLFSYLLGGA